MRLRRILLLCLVLVLPMSLDGQASLNPAPTMAAITSEGVFIFPAEGDPIPVFVSDDVLLTDLAWSPDGRYLAYSARWEESFNLLQVRVVDADGSNNAQLATGLRSSNIEFLPDGRLGFIRIIEDFPDIGTFNINERDMLFNLLLPYGIFAADPANPGAEPELVTTFLYAEGCGGGGRFPPQVRFEADMSTNRGGTLFRLTPEGNVLHSIRCPIEGRGLGRTGAAVDNFDQIFGGTREVISPDNTLAFAVGGESRPVWIDLATDTVTEIPLPPSMRAENAAWGPDNVMYISAREVVGTFDYTNGGQTEFLLTWDDAPPAAMPDYRATIHRYDPATGAISEILTQRGWGFAQMQVHDGVLYVSHHSDVRAWADAVVSGEITFDNQYSSAPVRITLLALDLQTGRLSVIGQDRRLFAIQPNAG